MGLTDNNEYAVWEVGGTPAYAGGEWSPLVPGTTKRGYRRVFMEPLLVTDDEPLTQKHWDDDREPSAAEAALPTYPYAAGDHGGTFLNETPTTDECLDNDSASSVSLLSSRRLRDIVLGDANEVKVHNQYQPRHTNISRASTGRSSAIPVKFDPIASLKMTYDAFKDPENDKEGIPLHLLPEVLEASRFVVPPSEEELLDIIHKMNQKYDPGDTLKWDLLLHIAMHLERKGKSSSSPATTNNNSSSKHMPKNSPPFIWKSLQKCALRRHDIEEYVGVEPQVLNTIKQLDQQRKKYEKEGDYVEARAAARKVNDLKVQETNKRRAAMLGRHIQERQNCERAYKAEIEEMSKTWNEKISQFQMEVMEHVSKLKKGHGSVLDNFRSKVALKKPCKPQWSAELLNQRKVQEYLGKQGKYSEALKVKRTADRLEQEELESTIEAYQAEVGMKEQAIKAKQHAEMEVILQKATKTREQLRESRAKDIQRVHQRHKNIVRELKALHAHENFKFDQIYGKKLGDYQANLSSRFLSPATRVYTSSLPRVAEVQVDEECLQNYQPDN